MGLPEIDFRKIRLYNGSKQNAFEEFCCQVFHMQPPDKRAEFYRKSGSGGDAGVEAYWKLPDGSEYGIQAKYFPDIFGDTQWREIDKSVKTALEKHPDLIKYVVCLPRALSDSRAVREGKRVTTQKDKWDDYVNTWKQFAEEKGIKNIDFVFWGSHEITSFLIERSNDPKVAGMIYYWFDETLLIQDWFEQKYRIAEKDLSERYSPEQHVDIPLKKIFDGLALNSAFLEDIVVEIENNLRNVKYREGEIKFNGDQSDIKKKINTVMEIITERINFLIERRVTIQEESNTNEIIALFEKLVETVNQLEDENDSIRIGKNRVLSAIRHFQDFFNKKSIKAAQKRVVFLKGEAGTGKSHLLCNVAKRHLEEGTPALLLLGQRLSNGRIEDWILNQLDLNNRFDSFQSFLGTLEQAAIASRGRALLLIDAINESENRKIWKNSLLGFIEQVSQFPHVAIAISCRTTFWDYTVPEGVLNSQSYVIVEHFGFRGVEFDAAAMFGIDLPDVPVLRPEFSNPLFLKTLAKTYGGKPFPKGQSFSNIYDTYLDAINGNVSARLDIDRSEKVVHKALTVLMEIMYPESMFYIEKSKAKKALEKICPTRNGYSKSLLFVLLDEGLIKEDIIKDYNTKQEQEIIRFQFERYKDYYLATLLLDRYFNIDNPEEFFLKNERAKILFGEKSYIYRGLWEIFMIIMPERYGRELYDYLEEYYPDKIEKFVSETFNAFGESIIWRKPGTTSDNTVKWFNRAKERWEQKQWYLLSSATIIDNHFNAIRLHNHLMRFKLNERDAVWGIFLSNGYYKEDEEVSPLYQIINWSLKQRHEDTNSEVVYLACIVLCWSLISSNRLVRDKATKALANLLNSQPEHIIPLLDLFKEVDDPYVTDRLYAAVYGSILHCYDEQIIRKVALWFFNNVFNKENGLPVHILIRDYARDIVEYAFYKGCLEQDFPIQMVRPPYKSEFPEDNLTNKEIEQMAESIGDKSIYWSIFHDDFGTYVLNEVFNWNAIPIDEEEIKTKEFFVNEFWKRVEKLSNADEIISCSKFLPDELRHPRYKEEQKGNNRNGMEIDLIDFLFLLNKEDDLSIDIDIDRNILGKVRQQRDEKRLNELLPVHEREHFRWLKGASDVPQFSRRRAKRWICKRAYSLGWEKDLFYDFERYYLPYHGRGAHIKERVGKKYQWIAFYEYLAYLADNYHFLGFWYDKNNPLPEYNGPWQLSRARKIDPTYWGEPLPEINNRAEWWVQYRPPERVTAVDKESRKKWLIDTSDLPEASELLSVVPPDEDETYLVLSASKNYKLQNDEQLNHKLQWETYISISSFVISKSDIEQFKAWAFKKSSHALLSEREMGSAFLGEYYWHPSFEEELWGDSEYPDFPCKDTVFRYQMSFSEYDFSYYDPDQQLQTIFLVPPVWIIKALGLQIKSGREPIWIAHNGEKAFYNPSCLEGGRPGALVKKQMFEEYLSKNELCLAWYIFIQKRVIDKKIKSTIGEVNYHGIFTLSDGLITGNYEERDRYFPNGD